MAETDASAAASAPQLLLVDDDLQLVRMLCEFLAGEGFRCRHASTGTSAIALLRDQHFDLAILDITMPEMDGLEVLRRLRESMDMPVLMLTARGDDDDRIVGLDLGADDYLGKPFNPRELVARIRAVLRRHDKTKVERRSPLRLGPLTLNPSEHAVGIDGRAVRLTTAEFVVLEVLARSAGTPQSRALLTERALGRPLEAYDRSIDTHVSNIRRKLGLGPGGRLEIRSMRGLGYMLSVTETEA